MSFLKKIFKKESQIKKERKDLSSQKEKAQSRAKKTEQAIKEPVVLPSTEEKIKSVSKSSKTKKTTEKKPTQIKSPQKDTKEKTAPSLGEKSSKSGTKKDIKTAFFILEQPHITEKASLLQQNNQYVFRVFSGANKTEIKKAIKELYNVEVQKVRIVHIPCKKHRLGRYTGWEKAYKKAIVNLQKGQKIEILPR